MKTNNILKVNIGGNNSDYLSAVEELKTDPPVLLAGSFVSTWHPTSQPNGQKVASDLFELLFPISITQISTKQNAYLKNIFYKVPFEHIFERCPIEQKILKIIINNFSFDNYNSIHKALIDGFIQNKIANIITTNYDLCFDKLLEQAATSDIKKVIKGIDIQSVHNSKKVYFKIHGSADDLAGESIVFTLRHESLMPEWKRKLLKELLINKNLLVIGYSGLDFEICPELLRIPIKRIFWNNFTDEFPSPNSELVLENNFNNVLLVGNMADLISDLTYPVFPKKGKINKSFVNEINTQLSEKELNFWRIILLNSMGCPSIALCICELFETTNSNVKDKLSIERQKAQALFHKGKYKTSAKYFLKAAHISNKTNYHSIEAESFLDACDAHRCYGAFIRSFKCLKNAFYALSFVSESKTRKKIIGKIHVKRILIYRHFFQISKYFRKIKEQIKRKCERELRIASRICIQMGNWFEFQQIRWWAERLDIDPKILADQNHYEAPPPKFGYDQLGYHIAQSGVFRDMLNKTKGELSIANRSLLLKHLENCKSFGNTPELWKLLYLKLKRDRKGVLTTFLEFTHKFLKCQYRPLFRIYQLVTGG
ncbi:MAG: SIR2 family protein [Ignavibacteriales bacterium]|nr:SIR2 family protein [Ignavibacteriales bacterium]